MEHRWGRRVEIDGQLKIRWAGSTVDGHLRNLSISGAFIATRVSLSAAARVIVEWNVEWYGRTESRRIAAYVVRSDPSGIAVEWCDVAPDWIVAMLADAPDCVPALRARSRQSRELRI